MIPMISTHLNKVRRRNLPFKKRIFLRERERERERENDIYVDRSRSLDSIGPEKVALPNTITIGQILHIARLSKMVVCAY